MQICHDGHVDNVQDILCGTAITIPHRILQQSTKGMVCHMGSGSECCNKTEDPNEAEDKEAVDTKRLGWLLDESTYLMCLVLDQHLEG